MQRDYSEGTTRGAPPLLPPVIVMLSEDCSAVGVGSHSPWVLSQMCRG